MNETRRQRDARLLSSEGKGYNRLDSSMKKHSPDTSMDYLSSVPARPILFPLYSRTSGTK